MRKRLLLLVVGLYLLCVPGRSQAAVYVQPSYGVAVYAYPFGWYGGFSLLAMELIKQSGGPEQLDSGAGFSLFGGWHATERLSLELGWLESFHNPARVDGWYGPDVDYLVLDGWMLDARIHLGGGRESGPFDPYVQGGLGLYALSSQHFGLDSIGTGFQLGGGFDYYLGPNFSFGARARYHGISMGPPEGGSDDLFISAATVEGNLTIHF